MSDERALFGEFMHAQMFNKQIEWLKAMVTVSTICPAELGSFAKPEVASQIYVRSYVELSSYRTNRCNFLCRFAKPFLASQSF